MFAKAQADDCHSLDVWKVQHDGCLAPGASGGLRWLRGDTEVASIGYRCLPTGALELSYTIPRTGQAYRDIVGTETMPMRRGRRIYWVCPGCHRLVQKLYLGGALFRCRDCYDLSYKTRQERGSRGLWLYAKAGELDRQLDLRWRRTSFSDITAAAYEPRVASEPGESMVGDEPSSPPQPAGGPAIDRRGMPLPLPLGSMPVGVEVGGVADGADDFLQRKGGRCHTGRRSADRRRAGNRHRTPVRGPLRGDQRPDSGLRCR